MASRDDEFTAFAEAASSRLLNTAYLLCGDWHTAEDLTQTTLAKVYSAWHRITRKDAVHAYAKRTLLNTYFVDCRRTRRGEILKSTEDLPEHTIEPQAHELRLTLIDALATLTTPTPFILPKRIAQTDAFTQITDPTGSGPFKMVMAEWQAGHKVVFARNADYVPRPEPPDGTTGGACNRTAALYARSDEPPDDPSTADAGAKSPRVNTDRPRWRPLARQSIHATE